MENYILIGNIIAFISAMIMVGIGFIKKKKSILVAQTFQMLTAALSDLVLKSTAGMISNIIGCVRNILCYKNKFGIFQKIVVGILAATFTLYFNNIGWIGLLPLMSTIIYIIFMNTEDVIKFKILLIVTIIPWIIHDIYINSFVYAFFDIGSVITNFISIIQIKKVDKSA